MLWPVIDVVCAVVVVDGRAMVCQRPWGKCEGGKWEFPGGKVEPGESLSEALIRELKEELAVDAEIGRVFRPVERLTFRLIGLETSLKGKPHLREALALRWVTAKEGDELDWADADIPLWEQIRPSLARLNP